MVLGKKMRVIILTTNNHWPKHPKQICCLNIFISVSDENKLTWKTAAVDKLVPESKHCFVLPRLTKAPANLNVTFQSLTKRQPVRTSDEMCGE